MEINNTTLKYYNENSEQLAQRYESAKVDDLHNLILEFIPPGSRLLELGFGSGRDLAFAYSKGFAVEGIDGSSTLLEQAEKIHPELTGCLRKGLIPQDLNLEPESCDGIVAIALLMHLTKDQIIDTFRQVYAGLKSGGRLIYSVPLTRDDVKEDNFDEKGRLFLSFKLEEWVKLATDQGFKLLKTNVTEDGLNRTGVSWLSCVVEK